MHGIHRMWAKAGSACRTNRSAIRRDEKGDRSARSGQLGYQLLELGLRPGAGGAGPHVSLRAQRERVFRHVVAIGSVDDDEEIVVAGGEIDLLDLDPQLLGELAGRLRPLGSVLDRTYALFGPAQRQDERRHAVLHGLVFPRAAKRRANLRGCEFSAARKNWRRIQECDARRRHDRGPSKSERKLGTLAPRAAHAIVTPKA